MRVLIQWADEVADWVEYDINSVRDIRTLPTRPISGVNLQGVVFQSWDHLGVDWGADPEWGFAVRIGAWNDDVEDYPLNGVPWGVEYHFGTPAPDPAYGGAINTRQRAVRYADDAVLHALTGTQWDTLALVWLTDPNRRPWSEWQGFRANQTLDGVWVDDATNLAQQAARSNRGWREWV